MDRRVEVGALDDSLELGQQPPRDAVAALGTVERDPRDPPVDLVLDRAHTGSARSMIALASTPAGQRPVHAAALAGEPRAQNASATAGGRVRTSSDALEGDREVLDHAARVELRARRLANTAAASLAHAREVGVEARVAAGRQLALGQERRQALGLLDHRAQHVERGDVARALPDRVQRRVAVEQRHSRVLDEAVAAQALERLGRVRGGALADPVLHHRGGEAAERGVVASS